ncbi:MAG: cytochrome P450 [Myxococcota bacterium]|nr:cytochrome P450 [Myxococcota bacterium]
MNRPKPRPQPPTTPLLGNVPVVGTSTPVQGLMKLAAEYGPVMHIDFAGRPVLFLSGHQVVSEVCDLGRFDKQLSGPLQQIRSFAGDGLFTAHTQEPNWGKAHRMLAPAFGQLAMKGYFDRMLDIADQMFDKWGRLGPKAELDVADNMTRLTLDTIALCGFDYRFNSFYRESMHPFVESMVRALDEAGMRAKLLKLQVKLRRAADRQYTQDIALMNRIVDEVIAERREMGDAAPTGDLLSRMLEATDPVTGEGLDDLNIRYQIVTFLIAGHETTSGLLSFATWYLLENPHVLERAREEVDRVLGRGRPRYEHMRELVYLEALLKETLRIWPTAPAFALQPLEDTTVGGYPVSKGEVIAVLIPQLHRDPSVWEDPERFDPERFMPGRREQIPPNAYKPFGHGQRACIGRQFALQEATLVLAMMLQRFEFVAGHGTPLVVKETLTLKPDGLLIRVRERPEPLERAGATPQEDPQDQTSEREAHGTPLQVLYGSNSGTAEGLARRVARQAERSGYAVEVAPMDAAVDKLPSSGALVVVTASYNGQPPDNAAAFVPWLETLAPGSLSGLRVGVLGCGHRDWQQTFQAIPKRVEAALQAAGAERLVDRGVLDAAGDLEDQAERWQGAFWSACDAAFEVQGVSQAAGPRLRILQSDPLAEAFDLQTVQVESVRELVDLSSPFGRSKKEVCLRLPEGMDYVPGDHLELLGENTPARVQAWLTRLDLPPYTLIVTEPAGEDTGAQTDPVPLERLLRLHLDLNQPASLKALRTLLAAVRCPPERADLARWLDDEAAYEREVRDTRLDLLTLLARCPSVDLPPETLLGLLPPNRPRRYSISSSPLVDPQRCTLTVAHVSGPALSGQGEYEGVGSGTLARAQAGTRLLAAVRAPHNPFHLPEDPRRPLLMIAAGTGMAPFRGFIEHRAQGRRAGIAVGPAVLFFGCDHPDVDLLYRPELEAWQAEGVLELHTAFFKQPAGQVHFVQHRLWAERERVRALLAKDAVLYLCGDGARMAPAVRETLARIVQETQQGSLEQARAEVQAWEDAGRLRVDVFG